ncbi:hypothetical protein BU23DRAFT_213986 [Bimuria novae-zelandiae CBS 107.79]|uniref:Uncharacterized protein n=1 Tax=Bimuria novae-zelandiae CBS 107.79 TaxID=1447943 RepID=A0A6A5V2P5_9PLEO|nr:hypothetical protein BU23DRAFT_213986 [Bimuria novae-zelandiae CBS 107.79]
MSTAVFSANTYIVACRCPGAVADTPCTPITHPSPSKTTTTSSWLRGKRALVCWCAHGSTCLASSRGLSHARQCRRFRNCEGSVSAKLIPISLPS